MKNFFMLITVLGLILGGAASVQAISKKAEINTRMATELPRYEDIPFCDDVLFIISSVDVCKSNWISKTHFSSKK